MNNEKSLHNSIDFNIFVLQVYTRCADEYRTFKGSRFPLDTMRSIEDCYSEKMTVSETALHINTH